MEMTPQHFHTIPTSCAILSPTCGHVMTGKGTPLKTSIFWAYFQMKQQLAIIAPPI